MTQVTVGNMTLKLDDHVRAAFISGYVREISKNGKVIMIELPTGNTQPRYTIQVTHINGVEVQS